MTDLTAIWNKGDDVVSKMVKDMVGELQIDVHWMLAIQKESNQSNI